MDAKCDLVRVGASERTERPGLTPPRKVNLNLGPVRPLSPADMLLFHSTNPGKCRSISAKIARSTCIFVSKGRRC